MMDLFAGRMRSRTVIITGLVALAGGAYFLLTGPRDIERYPPAGSSPYRLPWESGVGWICIQSNRGVVSHRGREEFAFDFRMPVGSVVCAARGGVVTRVVATNDGNGFNSPNNLIAIDHGDGTSGWYLHLKRAGVLVALGQKVEQGQKIGLSGNVGHSTGPHLHFDVRDTATNRTLPISFAAVHEDRGVPRMFFSYTAD